MDIFEFGAIVSGGEKRVLEYYQEHGLIRKGAECEPCGHSFMLVGKEGLCDRVHAVLCRL